MVDEPNPNPFNRRKHDHNHCIKSAMARAELSCLKAGLRFTKIRRQILRLVWSSHAPIKAYEILEQVHKHNPKAAPPTVYRALDFLMEAGLVHKLESINAFIGCDRPGQPHVGQFLICKTCGVAAEIHKPQITRMLSREARQLGFETQQQMVEIQGQCARCMKS